MTKYLPTLLVAAVVCLNPRAAAPQAGPPHTGKAAVLATGEHSTGVKVELLAVTRDSPTVVTVRWRYRNESAEPKRLTNQRTGSIDAYRLSLDSYLLDEVKRVKYPVARDSNREPVASRNGATNQYIVIAPKSTIDVWAKYVVGDDVSTVTVAIDGVPPFSGIAITR
ncbi:MAG: hypothetical protein ACM3SQ_05120 [Betaproteobacteria bacterium]